jgi:hypothetical protein
MNPAEIEAVLGLVALNHDLSRALSEERIADGARERIAIDDHRLLAMLGLLRLLSRVESAVTAYGCVPQVGGDSRDSTPFLSGRVLR